MQTSTPNASVLVDPLLTPMSQPKQVQHCHVPSNEPTFIFTENKVVGVLSCILCMATDTLPFAEEALLSNKCKEDKYWKPCSVPCSASATSPLLRNMPFRTSTADGDTWGLFPEGHGFHEHSVPGQYSSPGPLRNASNEVITRLWMEHNIVLNYQTTHACGDVGGSCSPHTIHQAMGETPPRHVAASTRARLMQFEGTHMQQ